MQQAWLPAEQWCAGNATLGVIEQPPSVREAEGERQEVRLCRQLVGDQQPALAQQHLSTYHTAHPDDQQQSKVLTTFHERARWAA